MGEAHAIADTGPLVAYLDRRDGYRDWASDQIDLIKPPLVVCEPVLSEAMFLLGHHPEAREAVLTMVAKGALKIAFSIGERLDKVRRLVGKYRSRPMSLADACIVPMAELNDDHVVWTIDSDFGVYRKHGRAPLTLTHPTIS
jgi:predicted nucleic acid-binding protein